MDGVLRVEASALGGYQLLGEGEQGRLSRVEVPGGPPELAGRPLAYKEYPVTALSTLDAAALEAVAGLAAALPPADRGWLAARIAWPLAVVTRAGAVCGVLTELAPAAFATPTGGPPGALSLEQLIGPAAPVPPSDRDRLELVRDLAVSLSWLHARDAACGDLSPRTVLVSLAPVRRTYLLDGDRVRLHGASALPQVDSPGYALPPREAPATVQGDRYKLALLALRLLAGDPYARDAAAIPAHLVAVRGVVEATLGATDPDDRPALPDWYAALDADLARVAVHTQALPSPAPPFAAAPFPAPPGGVPPLIPPPAVALAGDVPRRRRAGMVALAVVLVLVAGVVCVGGGIALRTLGGHATHTSSGPTGGTGGNGADRGGGTGTASPAPSSSPSPEPTASTAPTAVGLVDIQAVAGDPRAPAVAAMFSTYFTGINTGDYDSALSVYDPAGSLNPNDPKQRSSFISGVGTSQDSDIRLVALGSAPAPAVLSAHVTFRSNQDAGYGPKSNPDETCTLWDITYALTRNAGGYRILRPLNPRHAPC